ncbi:AAA family ATPase, partial [Escherichia coli]
ITSNLILKNIFKGLSRPFVITSERTGISLFYKEMDSHRSSLLNHWITSKSSMSTPINKKLSAYSTPISDNINIIRQYESLTKRKSFLYSKRSKRSNRLMTETLESMLSGSFKHANGETIFTKKEDDKDVSIPMSISSSSVKSLFLLDLYIKHVAQYGDFLVIDEPELNLHPENQVRMAELIVRLINLGIKIIMTTHSDYIIKEINNRIMLSNISKKENLYDLSFRDEDVLRQDRVSAFTICDDRKIKEIQVDKYGINQEIFDDVISSLNERSDLIYDALCQE